MRKLGRMTKPWIHIVKETHTEEVGSLSSLDYENTNM